MWKIIEVSSGVWEVWQGRRMRDSDLPSEDDAMDSVRRLCPRGTVVEVTYFDLYRTRVKV